MVGRRLADLAADHGLTVYETFLTDLAGHGRLAIEAAEVVWRLDELLGGILSRRAHGLTVVLTSDHGNFESRSTRGHTVNPVPLLAVGPAAVYFRRAKSLTDVAPRVLEVLGEKVPPGAPR